SHIHASQGAGDDRRFGSVFVGGGTPTYLAPTDLARVLAAVRAAFPVAPDAEWTVEANPETVTVEMAQGLAEAGVNRISLGAQSFDDRVLQTLGRWHDPASVATAVHRLRDAGVAHLSLDLIYGTPGETDESWRRSLDRVLDLGVEHVSAYALTVEPNTPYAARVRRQPALEPDEDVQAARMALAEERLAAAGLRRYEVSNWAVPGRESRHNLTYWRGGDWLAFGSGAHGAWQGRRWWLVRDPAKYARMVASGNEPLGGEEHVDADAVRLERLMMGLRLVEGVPRAEVQPLDPATVARLIAGGLLTPRDGDRLALTPAGMPLAGAVIRQLA
ncbi:MAG TPA: radical SAM family heme chaperone HemW, partial [Euzebya sp.]|nr:radical SAM family heme chaperone HemW [Euzebya sp.]